MSAQCAKAMATMPTTRFFGFLGPFPATFPAPDLLHYGNELTGRQPSAMVNDSNGAAWPTWADHSLADGEVAVALQGNAVWLDRASQAASVGSILEAYRDSGSKLLRSLHGSYALAIADARSRQLILAIDPMGIERLTYAVSGQAESSFQPQRRLSRDSRP